MKSMPIAVTTLALTIAAAYPSPEYGLVGCLDSSEIARGIGKFQDTNWMTISAGRVISSWPSRLGESACESEKGCRLLVSKSRIVGGHCECCEAFAFDVEPGANGVRIEHLRNIIIHFSSRSEGTTIDAAKKLARAAGLSDDKIAGITAKSLLRYEWSDSKNMFGRITRLSCKLLVRTAIGSSTFRLLPTRCESLFA